MTEADFHDIVSGRRRGAGASFARTLLRAAETPYAAAMRWRNWRYDRGRATIHRAAVPVISVGNLTMGGTGKTPMVQWLAAWFRQRDVRVCLISRGYKATDSARNDEAMELEQKLPDVPHLQNPDRVAAAQVAVEELDTQLILLDDAFQHRRIHRDLDIVLLDALQPFGHGHVFPRGTLREPIWGLARADLICLTRSDAVAKEEREAIAGKVAQVADETDWIETVAEPAELIDATGASQPLASLSGKRVLAFCGIGNPAGFRHTLDRAGLQVADFRTFADHHAYQREDLERLTRWAVEHPGVEAIVCTHKDLVKVGVTRLANKPLRALSIRLEVVAGREHLDRHLGNILQLVQNVPT